MNRSTRRATSCLFPLVAALVGCAGNGRPTGAAAASPAASLTPLADHVALSPNITHPYFPLSASRHTELRSDDETVIREVQNEMKTIAGVTCLVMAEHEYEDGELTEISLNYFAQDAGGNVYYFGENVDDYEDGIITGHGGTWLVGQHTPEPTLFMPAALNKGFVFKGENSPPIAEEWNQIETSTATLNVPAGAFRDVLVIKEADKPDQWKERKYYARGVGLISENKKLNLIAPGH